MPERLRFLVRTPREVVVDAQVASARVPTQTGQAGLRPHGEPLIAVVEPGLVVLRDDRGVRFAATAGGLLDAGRLRAELSTPFAVEGVSDAEVLAALDRAMATPAGEIAARRRLGELEQRIVKEIRGRSSDRRSRSVRD
jgi:F0F1-type ATP synthase epsilon subunit